MNHFDEEAEKSLIKALVYTDHTARICRDLEPEDFYLAQARDMFKMLKDAFLSGGFREMCSKVKQNGLPEVNDPVPVFDAIQCIRNQAIRRKVALALMQLEDMNEDYTKGLIEVQTKFKDLAVSIMDPRICKVPSDTQEDMAKYREEAKNHDRAFVTGLPELDRRVIVQPGDYVILGARPSVGKSALATTFVRANFLGTQRHKGIFMSIEMDRRQNYSRMVSQMSHVPLSKFFNSSDYPIKDYERAEILAAETKILANFPERWFMQGAVTLSDIEHVVEIERPEWIMIDYAQIISHKVRSGKTVEKLDEISVFLRQLALEKQVAIIIIVQLNRDVQGLPPTMSNIKGSGQFEQDGTHILLLDRPESEKTQKKIERNYHSRAGQKVEIHSEQGTTNRAALLVAKNRNGPTCYELLNFNPRTTAFTPFE